MSILYPALLWLLIPFTLLFVYRPKILIDTIHLLILMLMVIALSRPVIEQSPQTQKIEAKDVIIALDVSYSMRAEDIQPNRYQYAKTLINALLARNVGDNITLIAFTTNPLLLSPPTTDHTLISLALESLQTDNILTRGTSIQKLLGKVGVLPVNDKNLILITDGGEENDIETLQEIIRMHGIHPLILAMGTTTGATIPQKDGSLLKDSEGNLVVSRINPLLQNLAEQSRGKYLSASGSPQTDAQKLQEMLDEQAIQKNIIKKTARSYMELFWLPLIFGLVLFGLVHTKGVKYLLIIAALTGTQASASWLDGYRLQNAYESYDKAEYNITLETLSRLSTVSLQSRYAQANSAYKLGEYERALRLYRSIRTMSPKVKQTLYYNIANCYTMLLRYDKAKAYYTKALQLGSDADAEANLALIAMHKEESQMPGMSNPASQENSASTNQNQSDHDEQNEESQGQSGSGSGSGGSEQGKKNKEEIKLIEDTQSKEQPMGSKAYEMINKGYIHETQPW